MNKKFISLAMFGAFLLASTGAFVSCQDYDDDINGLKDRVDVVENDLKTVKGQLEDIIANGHYVTSVEDITENGVSGIAITFSNKVVKKIFNGKDGLQGQPGASGAAGHTPVVSINADGYWCVDNVSTGVKAKGDKGDQGDKGDKGENGTSSSTTPSVKVENNKLYVLDASGNYTEAFDFSTVQTGMYLVKKGTFYELHYIVTTEDNKKVDTCIILPSVPTLLQSVAFIPEVIDPALGLPYVSYYSIVDKSSNAAIVSNNVAMSFRINPTSACLDSVQWSFINRSVMTKAAGDKDDLISIIDTITGVDKGVATFVTRMDKNKALANATQNRHDIIALVAKDMRTNAEEESDIVSDYISVEAKALKDIRIADTTKTVGTTFVDYSTAIPALSYAADNSFKYTGTIDLDDLVGTYAAEIPQYLSKLGFTGIKYKFTKVSSYLGNDGITDQQKFVTMDANNVVSVNKEWLTNGGTAAIGRTPIFKVEALYGTKVLASAYIKLEIMKEVIGTNDKDPINVTVDCPAIEYMTINPTVGKTYDFTYDRMNAEVYDVLKLTHDTFFAHYNKPTNSALPTGVTAFCHDGTSATTGTTFAYITLDKTVKLGQGQVAITYPSKNKKAYGDVVITFKYNVTHAWQFPTLSANYAQNNIVTVKGKMVSGKYTMIAGLNEGFDNYLTGYDMPKNYSSYEFELKKTPIQTGAEISTVVAGTSYKDQTIRLTSGLVEDFRLYNVQLIATLANGETKAFDYQIKFIKPFVATVENITLKTLITPESADLKNIMTIKDLDGKVLYERGNWTSYESNYNIKGDATFAYSVNTSDPQLGGFLKENGSVVTWNNNGNILLNDLNTTGQVKVEIANLVTVTAPVSVKILSSEHSK